MLAPDPFTAPVVPLEAIAVQLKIVPATGLVIEIWTVFPEHNALLTTTTETFGCGLTMMV